MSTATPAVLELIHPAARQPTLPDLPQPDIDLLNKLISVNLCLYDLSEQTGLTLLSLLQWRGRPDIQAYVALYHERHSEANQCNAQRHVNAALQTMATLAEAAAPFNPRLSPTANTTLRLVRAPKPHAQSEPADKPFPFKPPTTA